MQKDFFDKDTLTAATARMLCHETTCYDCREFFGITDESCPSDIATIEQCVAFMQNLYTVFKDKFKDIPDWLEISFEDIEDIIKE